MVQHIWYFCRIIHQSNEGKEVLQIHNIHHRTQWSVIIFYCRSVLDINYSCIIFKPHKNAHLDHIYSSLGRFDPLLLVRVITNKERILRVLRDFLKLCCITNDNLKDLHANFYKHRNILSSKLYENMTLTSISWPLLKIGEDIFYKISDLRRKYMN